MSINYTLIGQSLTFILFALFCMKYVWPALISIMQEREQRIENGLQAAEQADKDLELAKKEAMKKLKEAKEEAASIVDAANKRASKIVDDAKAQAEEEVERTKTAARAEIEREATQAREKLRSSVASLALAGAEKVLAKSIDADAHSAMLDQLASEL